MSESDVTLLRRELHRMLEEHGRERKEWESGMKSVLDDNLGLRNTVTELRAEVVRLERRLAYYENPHTPPSKKPLPQTKHKRYKGEGGAPVKKKGDPGRKPGHEGVSSTRRAQKTEHHAPDRCARCGSSDLRKVGSTHKNITDIPEMPKPVTVCHVMHRCACNDCGAETSPGSVGIPGTEIGPNLATLAVKAWRRNASVTGVADYLSAFGIAVSRGAAQHLLEACGRRMEATAEQIRADLGKSDANHYDETGASLNGKKGWIWCGVANGAKGMFAVVIVVAGSRGRPVLDEFFPNWRSIPATTDGLSVYALIEIRQACMAHLMRESKYSSSDSRQAHMLHVRLKGVFQRAKDLAKASDRGPPDDLEDQILRLESEVLAIADEYERLGNKFCTTLRNAVPHMFVFVRHPRMEPTNNLAERMIRPAVVARAVRGKMVTPGGMRMFGTLMTCLLTWERRGADTTSELLGVLKN